MIRYVRLVLGLLALWPASAWAQAKLNVVFFLVDDLGWMDLGCQGSKYYHTPNIDRLAEEGMRFTDAYAACNVCSPTRAAIMTGKYPARLMLTQWLPAGRWQPQGHRLREARFLRSLPLEEITLAEALREAGYATLHVGKWHLGGPPFSLPEQHGFDRNVAGSEHGAPGGYWYPYTGKWTIPTTGSKVVKRTLPDGKEGEYLTDRLTDEAIKLIRENKVRPFFLYFPYYAVHAPLQGKREMAARYERVPEAKRQGKPRYAAMVESVDESVGRIMGTLQQLGLSERTLVVFTSDNGGFASATNNAPLRANKGSNYEGGLRVPLIVKWPGKILTGSVTDAPVISTDFYPTILEALGLPARPHQHLDGVSLVPLLTGRGMVDRESLYWHYPHYNRHPSSSPSGVIRQGKWKLIEHFETGKRELFDLGEDPGEAKDLAEALPEITRKLHADLVAWRIEVGADMPRNNPEYLNDKK
ncbi:MAG: sulfatase [Planctomycetes bacterium]|nr:sulfatase [Planctomycetota bacterium]